MINSVLGHKLGKPQTTLEDEKIAGVESGKNCEAQEDPLGCGCHWYFIDGRS